MKPKKEKRVLVIAGTYSEARNWAKDKKIGDTGWVWAGRTENFIGIHFHKYAKVGTYEQIFDDRLHDWFDMSLEPGAKDVTQ